MENIREYIIGDVPFLAPLFPENWNFNFSAFIKIHGHQSYFKGFTFIYNRNIIGFGNLFLFEKTAWLGNIVIDKNFRGKGFGLSITKHLMEYGEKVGIETFNLIATDLGKPVYEKLGFKEELIYNFYTSEKANLNFEIKYNIEQAKPDDFKAICALDNYVTSEKRTALLQQLMPKIFIIKYDDNQINGFFINGLETGSVIAIHENAGIELLKYKLNLGNTKIIIPDKNESINQLLSNSDFKKHLSLPKMVFGKKYSWHPEFIFNRGAGYSG